MRDFEFDPFPYIVGLFILCFMGLILYMSVSVGRDSAAVSQCRDHCATNHSTIHYDVDRDDDDISCICLKIEKAYSLEMK